jgi:hypothetical protein
MYIPFSVSCVLFVCECVFCYCHRVSTQLLLNTHNGSKRFAIPKWLRTTFVGEDKVNKYSLKFGNYKIFKFFLSNVRKKIHVMKPTWCTIYLQSIPSLYSYLYIWPTDCQLKHTTRIVRLKRGGTSLREKTGFKRKQANGVGAQLMKRERQVTACTAFLPCY